MQNKNILSMVLMLIVGILLGMLFSGNNVNMGGQSATVVNSTLPTMTAVSTSCDDNVMFGGAAGNDLVFTLQPGMTQKVQWNFTNCGNLGITNFMVYAAQPRPCPTCNQRDFAKNITLTINAVNTTNGEVGVWAGSQVSRYFYNDVGNSIVDVTLTNTGRKSIPVQMNWSGGMGGETTNL